MEPECTIVIYASVDWSYDTGLDACVLSEIITVFESKEAALQLLKERGFTPIKNWREEYTGGWRCGDRLAHVTTNRITITRHESILAYLERTSK